MSILLPPLPCFEQYAGQHKELRARDQEIVRCVREAAAKVFEAEVDTWDEMRKRGYSGAIRRKGAAAIRALEFKHHE